MASRCAFGYSRFEMQALHALIVAGIVAANSAFPSAEQGGSAVRVRNSEELRRALQNAPPGTEVLLEPGEYQGGLHFEGLRGSLARPILIRASDPKSPPRFVGGGLQFSKVSHLEIRDLAISGAKTNGLNIDDGGNLRQPSHHVVLRNIRVSDLPQGNHDGIKLSGIDDFLVADSVVERWGGSGIDMVGCHRGKIVGCTFRAGGDSGVQAKGGSSEISVVRCRFENPGHRGVNAGGSTGFEYFRPPLSDMPSNGKYEAKSITVEGCEFVGGVTPIAFVGVDGAVFRFNTVFEPERWAFRILQETRESGFVASRDGQFESNLIVFRSDRWFSGGVNVGPGTQPESFRFARNFWFCSDKPSSSRPQLPTPEIGGTYGLDPGVIDPTKGDVRVREGSPAQAVGAHAYRTADETLFSRLVSPTPAK